MPAIGIKCDALGKSVPFSKCWECENPCLPHPVLFALINPKPRPYKENSYYLTEILNPPQITYLQRTEGFYVHPQDVVNLMIGNAVHHEIENNWTQLTIPPIYHPDAMSDECTKEMQLLYDLDERYPQEHPFQVQFGDLELRARLDLYDSHSKTIYDHKVTGSYPVEKMLNGEWSTVSYDMQMNGYRVYGGLEVDKMFLTCFVKDRSYKLTALTFGCDKIVRIAVPKIEDDKVRRFFEEGIEETHHAVMTGEYRECTKEERWWNYKKNEPRRCKGYCNVADVCKQWNKG